MFERYTEKARRAVFFARFEVSQYGGSFIGTEHLLLGLLREDISLRSILKDTGQDSEIRTEIEKHLQRGKRIPTSVEIPLTPDSKKALNFAAEEAERLGQQHIGTEHMLLGILRVEISRGAEIIKARGLRIEQLRETFAKNPSETVTQASVEPAMPVLKAFLSGLKSLRGEDLVRFFFRNVRVVDVFGKSWNYEEIAASFEELFAPYAKKNATFVIEEVIVNSAVQFVAVVLWKNALVASIERVWVHRMTVVLSRHAESWAIVSVHVTPVRY